MYAYPATGNLLLQLVLPALAVLIFWVTRQATNCCAWWRTGCVTHCDTTTWWVLPMKVIHALAILPVWAVTSRTDAARAGNH